MLDANNALQFYWLLLLQNLCRSLLSRSFFALANSMYSAYGACLDVCVNDVLSLTSLDTSA